MFEFTFTPAEAQLVSGFVASILVPFIVSFLVRPATNKYVKLTVAVLVSALGAVLSQYAAGELSGGSVVVAVLGVFFAGQTHFASWFQGIGLKKSLESIGS